ncbi:hypothetical protein P7K49_028340 [Saguinus oedipus]|uniref:Uncharacterized protein n=1 Tax=Saguinus oedipus TaxID=9490 RepID=A0ABQ9UC07_SAGOE|nr:hypothetical protein P7K49_028340 [Saguinus oedipus]
MFLTIFLTKVRLRSPVRVLGKGHRDHLQLGCRTTQGQEWTAISKKFGWAGIIAGTPPTAKHAAPSKRVGAKGPPPGCTPALLGRILHLAHLLRTART